MVNLKKAQKDIANGVYDKVFSEIYGAEISIILNTRNRYFSAIQAFSDLYGKDSDISIYSTPGRTEFAGNHTDHNGGIAVAGAVESDIIAVCGHNNENITRVKSKGYDKTLTVDNTDLTIHEEEIGRSPSLIRGVVAGVLNFKGKVSGVNIYTTSTILKGSGLSSSSAFEVCLVNIFNWEFNNGCFDKIMLAQIAIWAENVYYKKSTGILDALTCSMGGIIKVVMNDFDMPKIQKLENYSIFTDCIMYITDTSGSHGNLSKEVSEICLDMRSIAGFLGKDMLCNLDEKTFYDNIIKLREYFSDRAVLRAIHFYDECKRAESIFKAMEKNNTDDFLKIILACGHSSFEYNQNAFSSTKPHTQGISLGLALSQRILENKGAWRLQGSGFAGTVQAFVPTDMKDFYREKMELVFGENSCRELKIRMVGSIKVL